MSVAKLKRNGKHDFHESQIFKLRHGIGTVWFSYTSSHSTPYPVVTPLVNFEKFSILR